MAGYGTVEIGGKVFIKRPQYFPAQQTIASNNQIITGASVVLPGVADFLLEGLSRVVTVSGAPVTNRPFRFRLGNSDGAVWYMSGGNGGSSDRIVDSLIFGNGQFPFMLTPGLAYSRTGAINYEVEDISGTNGQTIYFNFMGSYLIPTSA